MGAETGTAAVGATRCCALGQRERDLLHALRQRDEAAFSALVDAHGSWMLRTARAWVGSRAVAEEVVQETWLAAIRSVDRFEERSSLRTWLFTILANAARRQAIRENRSTSFSELLSRTAEAAEPDRLAAHARWPNCWTTSVAGWDRLPEERALAGETRRTIEAAQLVPCARELDLSGAAAESRPSTAGRYWRPTRRDVVGLARLTRNPSGPVPPAAIRAS